MFFHELIPIAFTLGPLEIRWYSLSYVFGIFLGWWYAKKLIVIKFQVIEKKFDLKEFDDLITYLIISIILGGRIGYIIFYNPIY